MTCPCFHPSAIHDPLSLPVHAYAQLHLSLPARRYMVTLLATGVKVGVDKYIFAILNHSRFMVIPYAPGDYSPGWVALIPFKILWRS